MATPFELRQFPLPDILYDKMLQESSIFEEEEEEEARLRVVLEDAPLPSDPLWDDTLDNSIW